MLDQYGNFIPDPVANTPMLPQQPSVVVPALTYVGPPHLNPPNCWSTQTDSNGRVWVYNNGAWA